MAAVEIWEDKIRNNGREKSDSVPLGRMATWF